MEKYLKSTKGFTLIEIMVVIVILSMLAILVGPKIIGRTDDAKIADAKVQIKNLETALKLYKLDSGELSGDRTRAQGFGGKADRWCHSEKLS